MVKSSDVEYWKPSKLNNISLLLGIWYGLLFDYLFRFIKSTKLFLGLGCGMYGAPHSEPFVL